MCHNNSRQNGVVLYITWIFAAIQATGPSLALSASLCLPLALSGRNLIVIWFIWFIVESTITIGQTTWDNGEQCLISDEHGD